MDDTATRLDGNAAAGLLREIFTVEMTTARAQCMNCGTMGEIGRAMVYTRGPGTILRCPRCDYVLMRIAHGPGRYWIDVRGVRWLEIFEAG